MQFNVLEEEIKVTFVNDRPVFYSSQPANDDWFACAIQILARLYSRECETAALRVLHRKLRAHRWSGLLSRSVAVFKVKMQRKGGF